MNGGFVRFLTWPALASMAGCTLLIALGVQSLSQGYMARVHSLLRSGPTRRGASGGAIGTFARCVTGKPSGRAAFSFVYGMARTDWQFRRVVYPALIQLLLLPTLGFIRGGLGHSPFTPGSPTVAQFLPHISGLIGLLFCLAISYSDQYRAAWIFLTFPQDSIRSFVKGIFLAILLPINALVFLLAPILIWRWGWIDALLFALYSVTVSSFYLSVELFIIEGMPFSNPPQSLKGSMAAPLVIAGLIGVLVVVGLQWLFIFQSRFVTAGAVLVFGGAAYLIAQISLRYLQTNILHNLYVIASGRGSTAMFKEVN